MAADDLNVWLKASAENKITTKNTWQSTLIEHFTDIDSFKSHGNINFQKASTTLEGCMKVFSTRVDDVSEKTQKLLELFNKEEEEENKKKPVNRKKSNFLEKNLNNINLKEKESEDFYDPVFSYVMSKTNDYFLQDVLDFSQGGMFLYSSPTSIISMNDEKIDLEIEILPICDSLKDFENQTVERVIEHDEPNFDEIENNYSNSEQENIELDDPDNYIPENLDDIANTVHMEIEEKNIYSETPFGYFKGWTGPNNWKIDLVLKKESTVKKETVKKRSFIDFNLNNDFSSLDNKIDTVMSKDAILERRRTKKVLPDDLSYEIKDLYKFNIKDGYFRIVQKTVDNIVENEIDVDNFPDVNNHGFELDDINNTDAELSFHMGQSLVLNDRIVDTFVEEDPKALKFTKIAKKVDIKKLKENVEKTIEKKSTIKEVFEEIPKFYSNKEAKDISIHFCLISLLHLANEKGLELKNEGDDIIITHK